MRVELSTILAGLSIGGLAIALAAQDVIKNLIGSINILLDRPFRIGDL
ncbi:MAG: mechanosensitive ion channel [Bacteroidetes bacterium]|nr:mechanosensitive ion channel [Bacteroidota bacterium]